MTEDIWAKSVGEDNQQHSIECVVSGTGKNAEPKVEPMKKFMLADDLQDLFSSEGVVTDISALKDWVVTQLEPADKKNPEAPEQPAPDAHVVGQRPAASLAVSRLTSLTDEHDSFQIGKRYDPTCAPPPHSAFHPHARRPAASPVSTPPEARRPAASPVSTPPEARTSPYFTIAASPSAASPFAHSAGPMPTTPIGLAAGVADAVVEEPPAPVESGCFVTESRPQLAVLPKRPHLTCEKGLDCIVKLSTDDAATAKHATITSLSKQVADAKNKLKCANLAGVLPILDVEVTILNAFADYAENQCLPSADKKKKVKQGTQPAKKTCDSELMYDSLIIFETRRVKTGLYVLRSVWECRLEHVFHLDCSGKSNTSSMRYMLSTTKAGDKESRILTLMDLMVRGVPQHATMEIQTSAVENIFSHALAKSFATDAIYLFAKELELVDSILNEELLEQLRVLLVLCKPETAGRNAINDALGKCQKNRDGIYHDIRFQKKGTALKTAAAKHCGQLLGQSLAVSKASKLDEALASLPHTFDPANKSVAETRAMYEEISAQAQGNAAFTSQHAETLGKYDTIAHDIRNDWRAHASIALEKIVLGLGNAANAHDSDVLADVETVENVRQLLTKEANHQLTNITDQLGKLQDDVDFVNRHIAYVKLHTAIANAMATPSAELLAHAASVYTESRSVAWRDADLVNRVGKVHTLYRNTVHNSLFVKVLDGHVDALATLADSVLPMDRFRDFADVLSSEQPLHMHFSFFASLPLGAKPGFDSTEFSSKFLDHASNIRVLATLSSLTAEEVCQLFHSQSVHHNIVGSMEVLKHVCDVVSLMCPIAVLPQPSFCSDNLRGKTKEAQEYVSAYISNLDSHSKCIRLYRDSRTSISGIVACGNIHAAFEAECAKSMSSPLPITGEWRPISTPSFGDLSALVPGINSWYMAYLVKLAKSVTDTLNELVGYVSDMRGEVENFKRAHASFEDLPTAAFTELLDSHKFMRNNSQYASALQTLSHHLKDKLADVNLVRESLVRSAVTLSSQAKETVGFLFCCMALSDKASKPGFAKNTLLQVDSFKVSIDASLLARVRQASTASAAVPAPAPTQPA